MSFAESYIGKLRAKVGQELLLLPTGAVIIERPGDGAVLMLRAKELPLWGLPGGAQDPGETIRETAIREAKEEVGLDVFDLVPYAVLSDPSKHTITYTNGDVCQYCCTMFVTQSFKGDIVRQEDEIEEIRWVLPDEMATLKIGAHAFHALELLREFRKNGEFCVD